LYSYCLSKHTASTDNYGFASYNFRLQQLYAISTASIVGWENLSGSRKVCSHVEVVVTLVHMALGDCAC